ncbi:MAG: preprotein translocase subunit SecG [bacterium]
MSTSSSTASTTIQNVQASVAQTGHSALSIALPYIQIGLSLLLIIAILIQYSEAGAGGAFGSSDSVSSWRTRRGPEKFMFIATIVIALLFVLSTILPVVFR